MGTKTNFLKFPSPGGVQEEPGGVLEESWRNIEKVGCAEQYYRERERDNIDQGGQRRCEVIIRVSEHQERQDRQPGSSCQHGNKYEKFLLGKIGIEIYKVNRLIGGENGMARAESWSETKK